MLSMNSAKVLLAEDDEYLLSGLVLALQRKGYSVETVRHGSQVVPTLASCSFDLLLLDLGLPGMDGTDVLSVLRSQGNEIPVIIITARDGVDDRITGLDLGANDYLVKPFDFGELEARMRASLRKSRWRNQLEIEFGSLKLNTNSGLLSLQGQAMDLTPKESSILKIFMSRAGTVVSKRQLIAQVSDWAEEASENSVEIIVHRLRKKLDKTDVTINTVRGFGYLLEEQK